MHESSRLAAPLAAPEVKPTNRAIVGSSAASSLLPARLRLSWQAARLLRTHAPPHANMPCAGHATIVATLHVPSRPMRCRLHTIAMSPQGHRAAQQHAGAPELPTISKAKASNAGAENPQTAHTAGAEPAAPPRNFEAPQGALVGRQGSPSARGSGAGSVPPSARRSADAQLERVRVSFDRQSSEKSKGGSSEDDGTCRRSITIGAADISVARSEPALQLQDPLERSNEPLRSSVGTRSTNTIVGCGRRSGGSGSGPAVATADGPDARKRDQHDGSQEHQVCAEVLRAFRCRAAKQHEAV